MHTAYPQSDTNQHYRNPKDDEGITNFQSIEDHIEFDRVLTANGMVDPAGIGERSEDYR